MKLRHVVPSLLLCLSAFAGDPRLITAPGQHSFRSTTLGVSPSAGSPNAIDYSLTFTAKVPNTFGPEFGPAKIEMKSSNTVTNCPVNPASWAFYVASESDLWFYDGLGSFRRFRNRGSGLRISQTCSDPTLASRAPRELKRFSRGR